jgi:transposase-like protein
MVQLTCYHCGSDQLARNGLTHNGKQRYLCSAYGRTSRDQPQANGYTAAERERILRAYHERSSLRGLTRTFGVARNTVSSWLKKKADAARVKRDADCPRPWQPRHDRLGVG